MSIISVRNLTFCYEGSFDNIFENVNFTIDTDWRLGFIGRNGRGKTTFLRLLMGDYAYEGSITASVHFDYFPFTVTNECLTAAEILLNVSGIAEYDFWRAERELGLLGVDESVLPVRLQRFPTEKKPNCCLPHSFSRKTIFCSLMNRRIILILTGDDSLRNISRANEGSFLCRTTGHSLMNALTMCCQLIAAR